MAPVRGRSFLFPGLIAAIGAGCSLDFTVRPKAGVSRDVAIDDVVASLRGQRGLRPSQPDNIAVITQDKLFETWG